MSNSIYSSSTFYEDNRLIKMEKDISTNQKVREAIKRELKKRKYTYQTFAELFRKTEGWFSHIMTGRTKLTIDLIYDIAEKLDIDPASLLPGRTESDPKISLEEYIRRIVREELEKTKKK